MPVDTTRTKRKRRLQARIRGTADRPRVSVFRSLRGIGVQLIDDDTRQTLVYAGGVPAKSTTKTEQAIAVGEEAAKKAKEQGIEHVVFDRNGYAYHGRIKALADSMREHGLDF